MNNLRTILLVEDNPQDEALIIRALRKANVANPVDVARDGQEALDYLLGEAAQPRRSTKILPAVVLLDINLPRVNGLDVLLAIRAHPQTRMVPVVMLTSSDEERDRFHSYQGGANSFVRKPLDFAEFALTVARLGIYWLAVNEPPTTRDDDA